MVGRKVATVNIKNISHKCALINLKYIIAIKSKQLEFINHV